MQFLFCLMIMLLLLILAGCSQLGFLSKKEAKLSSAAKNIPIVETLSPGELKRLKKLTEQSCALGQNNASKENNIRSCKIKIQNKAARMGATLLLIDPKTDIKSGDALKSTAFSGALNCENCIEVKGTPFRAKKGYAKKKSKIIETVRTDDLCNEVVNCAPAKKRDSKKNTY